MSSTTSTTDGDKEKLNYADRAVQTTYYDDAISEVGGPNTHFDDIVSRPSVLSLVNKAGLGPRAHVP
jgi:hypothetical protein